MCVFMYVCYYGVIEKRVHLACVNCKKGAIAETVTNCKMGTTWFTNCFGHKEFYGSPCSSTQLSPTLHEDAAFWGWEEDPDYPTIHDDNAIFVQKILLMMVPIRSIILRGLGAHTRGVWLGWGSGAFLVFEII
jgi:hypothetical protein